MKKIIVPIFVAAAFMSMHAQFPVTYSSSGNTALSSGNTNISSTNVELGASSYAVSSSAQLDVKASNEIHIQSDFKVDALSSTGYANLSIDPNMLAVASFHPYQFSNIPQYGRFELGMRLPASVQAQINTFLSTYTGSGPAPGLNPYDPDKIKVTCQFNGPSGLTFERNGFYYQEYSTANNTYYEEVTDYPFRIRVAPPRVGSYTCNISVFLNGSSTPAYTYNNIAFTVAPTANPGHLILTAPNLKRMKFENGTTFFGVGRGAAGAEYQCNGCGAYNSTNPSFNYSYIPDGHKIKASPATNNDYRNLILDLANKGGNFTRMRLDPWRYPIEYADVRTGVSNHYDIDHCLTNYHPNQMFLQEFDNTLSVYENLGVYMMLNIFNDGITNGANYLMEWEDFPYWTLSGIHQVSAIPPGYSNAMPAHATLQGVTDFFQNSVAKATFKKQLYYINARWGYSTSIAIWEMINETENIQWYDPSNQNPSTAVTTLRNSVKDWVCEMSAYLKTFYPQHLTSNGTTDQGFMDITHASQCLDIYSANKYSDEIDLSSTPQLPDRHINGHDINHMRGAQNFTETISKPFIWGEMGLGNDCVPGQSGWGAFDGFNDRGFHNTLWSTMVSGNVATGMYNNDAFASSGLDYFSHFAPLKKFVDNVDWTQELIPQRYNLPLGWANVRSSTGTSPTHLIYNLYMKDPTSTYVVGWSMLHTSFWTYDENYSPFSNYSQMLLCAGYPYGTSGQNNIIDYDISSSPTDAPVEIMNMSQPNRWYRMEIFDPHDANVATVSVPVVSDQNNSIKLHMPLYNHPSAANNYVPPDRAYIIHDDALEYWPPSESQGKSIQPGSQYENDLVVQYTSDIKGNDQQGPDEPVQILKYKDGKTYKEKISNTKLFNLEVQKMSVFPNPASSFIRIEYNDAFFTNAEITLCDLTGKLLLKENNIKTIDVRNLEQGLYLVKLKTDQGEKVFKVTITH